MVLPLIPIIIVAAIVLAVIGFIAIFDYIAIAAALVGALYIHNFISKNFKWGELAEIAVSIIAGFLLYKSFLGITLFVPLAVLIFFTPAVIKAYVTKKLMK